MNLCERILEQINGAGIHERSLLQRMSGENAAAVAMAVRSMLRDGTLVEREPQTYYRAPERAPQQRKLALSSTPQKRSTTGGAITECVMCGQFKRKAAEEVCGECRAEMDRIFNRGVIA